MLFRSLILHSPRNSLYEIPAWLLTTSRITDIVECNLGYNNLIDVKGGFKSIKEEGGFDLTDYVSNTTLL